VNVILNVLGYLLILNLKKKKKSVIKQGYKNMLENLLKSVCGSKSYAFQRKRKLFILWSIIDFSFKESLGKLRSWRVEHGKRNANSAAHVLAREAYSLRVWIEEISNCICDIVTGEQWLWLID